MKSLNKKIFFLLSFLFCVITLCSCFIFDPTEPSENPEPFSEFVNVIVLTEFQDAKFLPEDLENIEKSLNSDEDISVKQYFDKIGNLEMKSVFVFAESSIKVSDFKAFGSDSEGLKRQVNFAKELLKNQVIYKDVHKSEIFEGKLDNKKSGFLDSIIFYIPSTITNSNFDISSSLWPHTIFYSVNIGKFKNLNYKEFIVFPYKVQLFGDSPRGKNIIYNFSVGIMCHELLHVLGNDIGISDLYYYTDLNTHPVGLYDVMAYTDYYAPQQLNIYYRSLLGWATLTELNSDKIKIKKSEPTGIKFGEKDGEFFLVQYFEKSEICGTEYDEGILIYRINTNIKNGNVDKDIGEQVFLLRTDKYSVNYNAYNFPAIFITDSTFQDFIYSDGTKANFEIYIEIDEDNFYIEIL